VSQNVIKDIEEKLKKRGTKITIRAAIYRDIVDQVNNERFEICPFSDPTRVARWLYGVEAKNAPNDRTYTESLYYGVEKAVNYWSKKFSHDISTRVMVIIGDTGDDGSGSLQKVVSLLRKNLIYPVAIHLDLLPRNNKEKDAIAKYPVHMSDVTKGRWGDDLIPVQTIKIKSREKTDIQKDMTQGKLADTVKSITDIVNKFIAEIVFNRLGMKSFRDILCDVAFDRETSQDLNSKCRQCVDADDLSTFLKQFKDSQSDFKVVFATAMLQQTAAICSDCYKYIMEKPHMGFDDGYVATTFRDRIITRPILLLSYEELEEIKSSSRYFCRNNCDTGRNERMVVQSLATILGEALQMDAYDLKDDVIEKQFGLVVEPGQSFLVKDLASELCKDREKWKKVRTQLIKVPQNIKNVKARHKEEPYTDANGLHYYWIYPEEIFPPITE